VSAVTFFGGVANLAEMHVPYAPEQRRLTLAVVYPCGCIGHDVYDRHGDVALYVFHDPAPQHRKLWGDGGPMLEGDEWKQHPKRRSS